MSNIRVDGLDRLIKKLESVRADSNAVVERGLLKAAHRVRVRAVLLCPVRPINGGGLRDSIQVTKKAALTVAVGTSKEYAPYVEYGTGTLGDPSVPHTDKKSWCYKGEDGEWYTSHGQEAQPFLRPAVHTEEIIGIVSDEVKREIQNA